MITDENLDNVEAIQEVDNIETEEVNMQIQKFETPAKNKSYIDKTLDEILNRYNDPEEGVDKPGKKLRKRADIEKEKKFIKKFARNEFFDVEAELGSDDENHDDIKKAIRKDDAEEMDGEDLDQDLKDLIQDEAEESAEDIGEKYFNDMLEQDKEDVKKVIKGPDERIKRARTELDKEDDDYLPLNARIKRFKSDDDQGEFSYNVLFKNYETIEKKLNQEEDEENEEMKEMLQNYQENLLKKLTEKSKNGHKDFIQRMKENEKILENVINLNNNNTIENSIKLNNPINKKTNTIAPENSKNENKFFFKGNLNNASTVNGNSFSVIPISNTTTKIHSHIRFNPKNSFLHAMKNDKYFNKNQDNDFNLVKESSNSSLGLNTNSSTAGNGAKSDSAINNNRSFPIFNANLDLKKDNSNTNLSSLFTKSTKQRHNDNINKGRRISDTINNSSGKKKNSLKRVLE